MSSPSTDPDIQAIDRGQAPGWHGRSSFAEDSRKDPDDLEREIDETRAEVQATLYALERRLSPEQLLDRTIGRMRSQGGDFMHSLSDSVKQNPMPVLLTSIGIAWMMMSNGRRTNGGAHEVGERSHERWTHAKERMSGAGQALRERGSAARDTLERSRAAMARASHAVGERSGRAATAARQEFAHARSTFNDLLEEQPLVLGALGLAAGAIFGAALPATEREDRTLGRTRDRALDRARERGERRFEELRDRAEHMADDAKQRLEEGSRRDQEGRSGQSGVSGVGSETYRAGATGGNSSREDERSRERAGGGWPADEKAPRTRSEQSGSRGSEGKAPPL